MRTDVNKVAVSDNIMCNDRKDWRYVVGYQTDEKTLKNAFSYDISQADKGLPIC